MVLFCKNTIKQQLCRIYGFVSSQCCITGYIRSKVTEHILVIIILPVCPYLQAVIHGQKIVL